MLLSLGHWQMTTPLPLRTPLVLKNLLATMFLLTPLNHLSKVITHVLPQASKQCVTSLMYLLDEMECPDYGFKVIMDWARTCFEAGFDFNPKCKTRSGNLKWMYDALHNAEQMLPHLENIKLPDPFPNVKTTNVICYDFVPQLLSILQNKK